MRDLLPALDQWLDHGEDIALATVVRVRGSAPRLPGARLCVTRSGKMAGSVSGGCVETDVFEHAMQVLDSRQPRVASYTITDDDAFRVGLSCGGGIDVLIEPFAVDETWQALRWDIEHRRPVALALGAAPIALLGRRMVVDGATTRGAVAPELDAQIVAAARALLPHGGARSIDVPWRGEEARVLVEAFVPPLGLLIVGATHVGITLCRLAKALGFAVTVVDPRGLFATAERFPDADHLVKAWPQDALAGVLDASTYVVVLAHDPKVDVPAILNALRAQVPYVGVLGSRATQERRRAQLIKLGVSEAELARVRGPIGLDLGGRAPEEIALAILAEMVAVRYGRAGGPLSQPTGSAHGHT